MCVNVQFVHAIMSVTFFQSELCWSAFWYCLHSMWQGLCNGTVSTRLSLPSVDCCNSMRWVCCWVPCRQAISIHCCYGATQRSAANERTVMFTAAVDGYGATQRSAANERTVMFTAAVDGWSQTCYIYYCIFYYFVCVFCAFLLLSYVHVYVWLCVF